MGCRAEAGHLWPAACQLVPFPASSHISWSCGRGSAGGLQGHLQDTLSGQTCFGLPDILCVWPEPLGCQESLPYTDLIPSGWRGNDFLVSGLLREPQIGGLRVCRDERLREPCSLGSQAASGRPPAAPTPTPRKGKPSGLSPTSFQGISTKTEPSREVSK